MMNEDYRKHDEEDPLDTMARKAIRLRHKSAAANYLNSAAELHILSFGIKETIQKLKKLAENLEEFE